jgi:tRNA-Thr(GGU) m(6)t(6)A37 methyltransferase TsaA
MAEAFEIVPIGVVRGGRTEATDDDWGESLATIELDGDRFTTDVIAGLDEFSHLEVIYLFDRVDEPAVHLGARHPRGRSDWPLVGIFAQRAKARPNRLGVTVCEMVAIDGLDIVVRGLDAIDGTPVIDIKPYMKEFGPRTPTRQPMWSMELMRGYW